MSNSSNAVVYALICGLIFFLVLPHALAALDRWRFLKRLRRAFESGTLQPRWPPEAAMRPCEIKDMCEAWVNSAVCGSGNDEIDLVSCSPSMPSWWTCLTYMLLWYSGSPCWAALRLLMTMTNYARLWGGSPRLPKT